MFEYGKGIDYEIILTKSYINELTLEELRFEEDTPIVYGSEDAKMKFDKEKQEE